MDIYHSARATFVSIISMILSAYRVAILNRLFDLAARYDGLHILSFTSFMVTQHYNDLSLHQDGRPHRHSSLSFITLSMRTIVLSSLGGWSCVRNLFTVHLNLFFFSCLSSLPSLRFSQVLSMKAPLSVCRMVLILICDFMVMRLFAQMIPRLKIPVVFSSLFFSSL